VRTDLCQPSLGRGPEPVEDCARNRELEDAVAEELEPLVRLRPLFGPRRVGEDLLQLVGRQLEDQTSELVRPDVVARLSLDAR
jgi:hypothetical protein